MGLFGDIADTVSDTVSDGVDAIGDGADSTVTRRWSGPGSTSSTCSPCRPTSRSQLPQ